MEKLEPCRRCKSTNVLLCDELCSYVACNDCKYTGPEFEWSSFVGHRSSEAITAWNTSGGNDE